MRKIAFFLCVLGAVYLWHNGGNGSGIFSFSTAAESLKHLWEKASDVPGASTPAGGAGAPLPPAKGDVLEGNAVHIADGDTFDLLTGVRKKLRVRLSGIDAPEKAQDYGQVAKEGLGRLLQDQFLKVVVRDIDRYGRTVCDVYALKPSGEEWVNQQMVASGWAWHYRQYSKDPQLAAAEETARARKKGLWSQPAPNAPWLFRAAKRRK